MNDITASTCADVNLFADDTSAFTVSDSAQNLQLSLQTVANDLSSWFKSWALTINVEKTAVMVLCTRQKVPTISIIINGSEIKQVRVQRHHGLNIDERLTWTDHVSAIVNKTSSRLGLLRRLRPRVPPLVIQTLRQFRTCVLPVLEYASLAWSGLGTINAERLERLQRTAARLITGTRLVENVPREILLARAGLDKLADCQKIKSGLFAFKLAFRKDSNCLPRHILEAAETWLSLAPDRISAMNSRSQSRAAAIRLPRARTNTMKSSPFYFCFSVLNSVPLDNLKSEASVKEYLLSCQ